MHPHTVDITGQTFGRLTVIGPGAVVNKRRCWICRCVCGTTIEITGGNLKSGNTTSCGCFHREVFSRIVTDTNTTHGHAYSSTYESWRAMLTRCRNPKASNYANYGGRGISVCERWQTFEGFLADMGERPDGHTIDRFPNQDGDYEPGNCRWATPGQQRNNQHDNLRLTLNGETKTAAEWARELGMRRNTIYKRIRLGWPPEKILTTPLRTR